VLPTHRGGMRPVVSGVSAVNPLVIHDVYEKRVSNYFSAMLNIHNITSVPRSALPGERIGVQIWQAM
jgi:hypothetical protein